jgi:hypothetical protein
VATKFYTFHQNRINGCGYEIDEEVHTSRYVIIEADSADDANTRVRKLGLAWDGRWPRVNEAMSDDTPSVFSEPVGTMEGPPDRFNVDTELDKPMITIHYQDGRIETFTPRVRMVAESIRDARDHVLVEGHDFGGWRHRVKCTECGAEFTVPKRTALGTVTIAGCRGEDGTHPADTCECTECDPM